MCISHAHRHCLLPPWISAAWLFMTYPRFLNLCMCHVSCTRSRSADGVTPHHLPLLSAHWLKTFPSHICTAPVEFVRIFAILSVPDQPRPTGRAGHMKLCTHPSHQLNFLEHNEQFFKWINQMFREWRGGGPDPEADVHQNQGAGAHHQVSEGDHSRSSYENWGKNVQKYVSLVFMSFVF